MKTRKLVSHVVLLVFFAVAAPGFAFGQPPPQHEPEPGITAPQAV